MRPLLAACLTLASAAFALPVAGANLPTLEAVSVADASLPKGVSAHGDSMGSMLTASGDFVVFTSSAHDLVPGEYWSGVIDLYQRNRSNRLTTLVSVNATGTGGGDGHSAYATVTPDGRYVAFESLAGNLVASDTNALSDVFVRDVVFHETRLVSVNAAGMASGDGASASPTMTPDGRFVAFVSAATDLVADDTNGIPDVFVRDLQTGITTLVSTNAEAAYVGWSKSDSPVISANGQLVAFMSTATNLVAGATNWAGEVYLRDLVAGTTTWASSNATAVFEAATGGSVGSTAPSSWAPALSENGRFLAFKTYTTYTPLGETNSYRVFFILRWDRETGATDLVSTNAQGNLIGFPDLSGPAMTPDGRFIAYASAVTTNSTSDLFVWDAQDGATTLVSAAMDGVSGADGFADTPALTPDGHYVTFVSNATNLVPNTASHEFRVYRRDRQSGVTSLMTADPAGEAVGEGDAAIPMLSDDGRWVAVDSRSKDLVMEDENSAFDVFVRDGVVGQTELVSSRDIALTCVTGNGLSSVSPNCLSADGRHLVFVSQASDLVANDTNGLQDVFVRDLQTGTNLLVSVANGGTQADRPSYSPVVSADGKSVAFVSSATNLAGPVCNRQDNIYVRDVAAGTTTLVTVSTNGLEAGSAASSSPSISADGRRVAFQTAAYNLAPGTGDASPHVLVRDLEAGTNYLVKAPLRGCVRPVISPDGRTVVVGCGTSPFYLVANDLEVGGVTVLATNFDYPVISGNGRILAARYRTSPDQLLVRGLVEQTNRISIFPAVTGGTPPRSMGMSLSFDGRFVALASRSPITGRDTNNRSDVFVCDTWTGEMTLVSGNRDGTGTADCESDAPSISADGRFVAYESYATDLVPEDTGGRRHVFLHDRLSGRNSLVSRNLGGSSGASNSSGTPVVSGNGKWVVFGSLADDLITGDLNQTKDVFLRGVVAAPRIEVLGPSPSGAITLEWDASPGETYQVQHNGDLLGSAWNVSPGEITVNGARASWTEPVTVSPGQRFYRVAVIE